MPCLVVHGTQSKCCAETPVRAWNSQSPLDETLSAKLLNAERRSKTSKLATKSGESSLPSETAAMRSLLLSRLVTYVFFYTSPSYDLKLIYCRSRKHPKTQVTC